MFFLLIIDCCLSANGSQYVFIDTVLFLPSETHWNDFSKLTNSTMQVTAVWHNMREEPVVYINGRPFVLREEARPFKNLREYSGIEAYRLEQMEERLMRDVLDEVRFYSQQAFTSEGMHR